MINYHLEKANVVRDTLRIKVVGTLSNVARYFNSFGNRDLKFGLKLVSQRKVGYMVILSIQPSLLERIKTAQSTNLVIVKIKANVKVGDYSKLIIF